VEKLRVLGIQMAFAISPLGGAYIRARSRDPTHNPESTVPIEVLPNGSLIDRK
jgi:hypothetical protein